jgi:hypothetical protein
MNEGLLPGVKIGREWICTRTALLTELTRLSLANVGRRTQSSAPATPINQILRQAPHPMQPGTGEKRRGRPRNFPPVLPPFPGT